MDDLLPCYRRARVVAIATRDGYGRGPAEAAGIVLVEGMAYGRPVVAPADVGVIEVVGEAGTTVPDPDPPSLAAALRPYLVNPALAAEVGERGRRRVEGRYRWSASVERLVDLYRGLAG
jgi:glycosyltransferase involved in cell wall biosynthesis